MTEKERVVQFLIQIVDSFGVWLTGSGYVGKVKSGEVILSECQHSNN